MEAHVMVARHHVNSGIFSRRKQGVEPLDIILKFRGRAPETLVKEITKEEYVLRTEISLGRLECPEKPGRPR